MNISHPSLHTSGIQRLPELNTDRQIRTEQSGEKAVESAVTKPSLWEILTPEEREFFEQQASLGPLTYRPGDTATNELSVPTGRRIDVRG